MLAHIPTEFTKRLETAEPLKPSSIDYLLYCIKGMGGVNLTGNPDAHLFTACPPNRYDKN